MSQKAKRLKRYLYISQGKINMFDQQSDTNLFQEFAGTLQSWLLTTTRIKVKDIELERTPTGDPLLHSKLTKILDRLEKEHGNEIGTVDTPAEYIRDTLPMFYRLIPVLYPLLRVGFCRAVFQVQFCISNRCPLREGYTTLIPSRPNYHRLKNDPGFVYFSGSTQHTVIALVGSPFHLLGRAKDPSEEPSSDLPLLVAYINERLGEIVEDYYKEQDHGLLAIQHAGNNNKDPRIPMEFFAYRILDSADIKGMHPRKRILLYTPLYVAYASDNVRKP